MLQRKFFIFLGMGIILVLAQACNLPGSTLATQTPQGFDPLVAAQLTIAAATGQAPTSSLPSFTPQPTLTLAPTFTFTPAFTSTPMVTPTPNFSYVTLSVATNCRTGPGKTFDLIDTFNLGQTIEVFGKNPTAEYWYVRSPNNQTVFCWLWGFYATGGNLGSVAMFTPPPTPTSTPSFELNYTSLDNCSGNWWVEVNLKNISTTTFKSMSISVRDTAIDVTLSDSNNEFVNNDGCLVSNNVSKIDPGDSYIVSAPSFAADPTGHTIQATLTLCTENNQSGQCSTKTIEFKP